jgi:hypothetical protein
MAVVKTRRLVANPQRRSRKRKKSNPRGHRRRMTAKQIKFFGTKRQKAALKASRTRRHGKVLGALRGALALNPKKTRARRRNAPKRRKRQLNPALLVTLGAVNPRRNSSMARRRKKARKAANPRRRRRNTTRVVVAAPRRRAVSHRRRRRALNPRRRRNPAFGMRGSGMAKAVVAGLAGMAAAKLIPTLIPSSIVNSNIMRTLATGASAFVAQMVAKQVTKDPSIADAVLFGGLMQTGSTALNAFLPSLASSLGLSGIMDARWSIPENPLRGGVPAVATTEKGVAGLSRAYTAAY